MAKTKEKVVELKPKVEKISDEHLSQLQELVNRINAIQFNIGKIEAQKHGALHELAKNQDQISVMQDLLMKEYGSYDVSLEDGKINWPEEPSKNGVDKSNKDEK
jgi:hypothetical protein|tara:strand:- start:545 stop:856 length:312 start_codon:yes stop_codon:yes gene_type:complete